jgi:O-antigen ligase
MIMTINLQSWTAWAVLLPLLAVFVEPFGRLVEVPVIIMAIVGLYDFAINSNRFRSSAGFKLFTVFFLCFWIPALVSLPDAINFKRSMVSAVGMLRFYFAGLFLISRLTNIKAHQWLGYGIALILLFWSVDGWVQSIFGNDIFAIPSYSESRVSGIFGTSPRLGLMMIPFVGVAIVVINERLGLNATIISVLFIVSIIIISGDRASWVSLLVMIIFFLTLFRSKKVFFSQQHQVVFFFVFLIFVGAIANSTQFRSRLDSVLVAFNGDYESINKASSSRLPIWLVAGKIFEDHPINGVGVRGFRYAYPQYAESDDIFVSSKSGEVRPIGAYHPHQLVLELLTDAGILGVIGYIIALWLVFIKWRPIALAKKSAIASGYLISLMALLFPVNSHLSIYSSDFGQVFWLVTALCVSALITPSQQRTNQG